jgi:hypothetical protein
MTFGARCETLVISSLAFLGKFSRKIFQRGKIYFLAPCINFTKLCSRLKLGSEAAQTATQRSQHHNQAADDNRRDDRRHDTYVRSCDHKPLLYDSSWFLLGGKNLAEFRKPRKLHTPSRRAIRHHTASRGKNSRTLIFSLGRAPPTALTNTATPYDDYATRFFCFVP